MGMKRRISAFAATFAAVMIGGAALAAVGSMSSSQPAPAAQSRDAGEAAPTPATKPPTNATVVVPADPEPRAGIEVKAPEAAATIEAAGKPVEDDSKREPPGDHTGPRLKILEPESGAELHQQVVRFFGETDPNATVTFGDRAAEVDDDGRWWIVIVLDRGKSVLVFHASDPAGNVSKAETTVYFTPEPDWEFTAHQRWEVVDGDPAVNIYWGTSKPGALVTVESRFGSGRTEANDNGKWELRVKFPEAPCNEPFRVVAASGDHHKEFKMKRACAVDVAFTANQKYGECGEAVPYDVFWGTATPGAEVWVESPYGSESTLADESGHWEIKVEFPTAPAGTLFEVAVESSDGGMAWFTFVNVGG